MQFILGVRRIKGEMNIAPGTRLPVLLENASDQDREWLDTSRRYLDFLARVESVTVLEPNAHVPESAMALVGEMKILIPMAGLIDQEAEVKRLEKERAKVSADLERSRRKLANPSFVDKAPPQVVQKERERISEQQAAVTELEKQLARIRALRVS
jgi:valyl-tRNA synthetase